MPELTIIGAPQSSFTWAVRIFAEERGVAYTLDPAPPHSDKVLAINPLGKIPVMRAGGEELAESRAISAWIDARAEGPSGMPQNAAEERWLSAIQTGIDKALIRDYALPYLFPRGADGQPDRAALDAGLPAVERAFDAVDLALEEGVIGGTRWSILDAQLTPILFYANLFPEGQAGIAARPRIAAYLQAMMARPSFAATAPPSG